MRALGCSSGLSSKIIYEDIPIKVYNIPHAIGKSHDGGASGGKFIELYTLIEFLVKNDANPPTIHGIIKFKIKDLSFIIKIHLFRIFLYYM